MRKDKRNSGEPKGVYRVRNWSGYNAGLIARGSVTMWINESALTMVSEAEPVMRGRPHVYSDALIFIQALLTLKQVYHLTLRAGVARGKCRARNVHQDPSGEVPQQYY